MKKVLFTLICIVPSLLWAQSGYRISGKFIGIKGGVCNLVLHYGKQYPIADTSKIDEEGNFVFEGTKPLEQGLYLIAFPGRGVEVIVTKEQHFSVEVDTARVVESIQVNGSPETQLYYEHHRTILALNKDFDKRLQEKGLVNRDLKDLAFKEEWGKIQEELAKYLKKFFRKNSETFTAKLVRAYQDPDVPTLSKKGGGVDSLAMYYYGKAHYFDNIDFNDARLLYSPVIEQRLVKFVSTMLYPTADSINAAADYLLTKVNDPKVRKYIVIFFSKKYEIPPTLGHDGIYTHVLEKYYLGEPTLWDSSTLVQVRRILKIQKPILMGKIIPDIILQDTLNQSFNLHGIQAKYLVLFLYNPGCGHCKAAAPLMAAFYEKYKSKGIAVLAASVYNEEEPWRKFVREQKIGNLLNGRDMLGIVDFEQFNLLQFPMIYILDKDKKIIAKYLQESQVEPLIDSFEREEADRAKKAETKNGN
ncbi:MAG: DUF5106 domain-containing protein [Spirosomataceae bacterium]